MISFQSHIEPEKLELYAMGRMSEEQSVQVEEHLLLCADCQDQLQEFDVFLQALRQVSVKVPKAQPSLGARLREFFQSLIPARPTYALGAIAASVLAIVMLVPRQQQQALGTFAVNLESTRGDNLTGAVTAPANYRLQLSLDLRGVAERENYSVTIASSSGDAIFTTRATPAGTRLPVLADKPLRPGDYWIRVSEPAEPHALLREFSLTVK